MAVILGIDVGEKKIGLALGRTDDGWVFARPPLLIQHWGEAWPVIQKMLVDENVDRIVVGLPFAGDGQIGPQAQRTREFIAGLKHQVMLPIIEHDERHTTAAVQREQAGRSLRRGQEDSLAAQLLVESYLQELKP